MNNLVIDQILIQLTCEILKNFSWKDVIENHDEMRTQLFCEFYFNEY